jgi:peptidoglycan hydrolase-like protein with peptidoglycan-binding domain
MRRAALALLATLVLASCNTDTAARARQAAEKIKESIPDVEAKALAQKVSEDDVRQAQQALRAAKEYLGEVDGKLDSVTVNALEAFQRTHGLKDDGILNEATKKGLRGELAAK